MTDKIIVSRKEIEKLRNLTRYSFLSPSEGGVRRFQDKSGAWVDRYEMVKIIEDLLDKAEVVSGEAVGVVDWDYDQGGMATGQYAVLTQSHKIPDGTKLYTSPLDQSAKIAELEAEIARLNAITLMLLKSPS